MKYQPELDGLRAVAIILVVLNHVWESSFPGGFIGVDLFFVLSGYLITTILHREWLDHGRIRLGQFYVRRCLRLMPPLLVLLTVYMAMVTAWIVLSDSRLGHAKPYVLSALTTAFYSMNWSAALGIGPTHYLLHTWSLGVEEQFYILWPLLLLLTIRWHARACLGCIIVLIVVCTLWRTSLWLGGVVPNRTYMGFDTRLDNLLWGCLLALVPWSWRLRQWAASYVLVPIIAMTAIVALAGWNKTFYQVGMPIIAVLVVWIIMATMAAPNSQLSRMLRLRPMNYLGRISYGYYLWHYPIFIAFGLLMAETSTTALATIFVTLIVAALNYHLLEIRMLRWRTRFRTPAS